MSTAQPYDRRAFFISVILIFIIILLSGIMGIFLLSDESVDQALLMVSAVSIIEENYAEPLDYSEFAKAGRKAMFDKLDRYSGYVSSDGFDLLNENLSGGYTGFGLTIQEHEKGLLVISVRNEGTAAKAGILSGDIITQVDSAVLVGLDGQTSLEHLRGDEGTTADLTIYRAVDESSFKVTLERMRLVFQHIPFAGFTEDSIIYIRLLDFDPGASDAVKTAIDSLLEKSENPNGLILDLRGNPGGLFREARNIADLFLESGFMMVGNDSRSRWEDKTFFSSGDDITNGLPMAVLVDGGSASASEVVSGALKYSGRALLVGDTTFGKGLVQGFVRYPDGDGMRLTISRYFFEGDIYLNDFDSALIDTGHGLVPDHFYKDNTPEYLRFEIERSNILRRFAGIHQSDILAEFSSDSLSDNWIPMLADFIEKEEDTIQSYRTELSYALKDVAREAEASKELLKTIDNLIELSQKYDLNSLYFHKDFIKSRLVENAVERSEGVYQAYRKSVIKNREIIKLASSILLEQKN